MSRQAPESRAFAYRSAGEGVTMMTHRFTFRPLVLAAVIAGGPFVPSAAAAQEPAPPVSSAVSAGQKVLLNLKSGMTRDGVVWSSSANAIELMKDGRRETVAATDISTITLVYRDPISDGAKKGALYGLAIGAALGVVGVLPACREEDSFLDLCSPIGFLLFGGIFGGFGTGIGAAAGVIGDAYRLSSREVWRASGSSRFSVSALAGPGRAGGKLTIRW